MDGLFTWLDLGEQARSFRAVTAFAKATGKKIGQRAQGVAMRGSVLMVRVTSAAWSLELSMMEKELVASCKKIPGGEPIESLRFLVGPLVETPREEAPPPPPALQRPDVDVGQVIGALSKVEDRELREDLGRLVTRFCTPP